MDSKKLEILQQNNAESKSLVKKCLQDSLLELMQTKKFESISITDIARRAGVSRNAYYRNYDSKEAILEELLQKIVIESSSEMAKFDPILETKQTWIALLNITKKYYKEYKMLINAGLSQAIQDTFVKNLHKNTMRDFSQSLHNLDSKKLGNMEFFNNKSSNKSAIFYSNHYYIGGICSTLFAWIQNDMNENVETIANIGTTIMQQGIKSLLLYNFE
ncbi:TetR family transcriptional regulator [Helicobacter saguini]|uniref:TetR family transcriptional regulator n=1 Tax=Helicobacter saguini TaxID=1548018 RepID=A0A347VNX0_9HELI|nr:TetR/AcrR family transcriptional regulator [Helicobacter saguini]MWV61603.1 TetR family transcriptional regulator [Helicobacter saguini]MWV67725.1 TetR family transcriptional regulator [Helicobacter saguini]MWV70077.1 TetR family transcriptional regulator [Helicobacter saguini]MWV72710.1 TetR family transcriptional regulator [Helicobacter saguini]TLD92024.1 TetR/AcrR family transcriptional regulator [Helicobacter saguini]